MGGVLPGGMCAVLPGGCGPSGGGVLPGVWSGGVLRGGACLVQGVVSQHALKQTPPRQTHECENITFTTSLRTVKIAPCERDLRSTEQNTGEYTC